MAISNADLAQKISDLIDFWSNLTVEYKNWLGGAIGGGPNSDGRYPLTDFTGIETLVESPAQLSDDVGGFVDQAQTAETNAAASAVAALASENEATTQFGLADAARILAETARTAAETAESSAINEAVTAVTQANLATDRAGYAQEWANLPFETLVSAAAGGDQVDDFSALHWATVAEAFAGSIDSNLYGQLAQAEIVTGGWTHNVQANAMSEIIIGESSVLRGDLANSRIVMYDEHLGVIYNAILQVASQRLTITGTINKIQMFQNLEMLSGKLFRQFSTSNLLWNQISHDGTHTIWTVQQNGGGFGAEDFQVSNYSGNFWLRDGMGFRISDDGDTDWAEFYHDGLDFNTDFVNTADWNITGVARTIFPTRVEILTGQYTQSGHEGLYLHSNVSGAGDGAFGPGIIFGAPTANSEANRDGAAIHSVQFGADPDNCGIGISIRADSNNTPRVLRFAFKGGGGVGGTPMFGIGTGDPQFNLDVQGEGRFTGLIFPEIGFQNDFLQFSEVQGLSAGWTNGGVVLLFNIGVDDNQNDNFVDGVYYIRRSTSIRTALSINLNFNTDDNGNVGGNARATTISTYTDWRMITCTYDGEEYLAIEFTGDKPRDGSFFYGIINSSGSEVTFRAVDIDSGLLSGIAAYVSSTTDNTRDFNDSSIFETVGIGTGTTAPSEVLEVVGNILASGTIIGSNLNVSDWDTAFGWGNHASVGYITELSEDSTPVLGGNLSVGGNYITETNHGRVGTQSLQSQLTLASEWRDLPVGSHHFVNTTTGIAGGSPVNNFGYFIKVANRDTGPGWGGLWVGYANDQNYIGRSTDGSAFAIWTKLITEQTAEVANWNTAFGWGNHASADYAVTTGDTFTGILNVLKDGTIQELKASTVEAAHTTPHQMRIGWSATFNRMFFAPRVDGTYEFGKEFSFDFASERWVFDADISIAGENYGSATHAPISHTHNASDIDAGTLLVARGGTGQTSIASLAGVLDNEAFDFSNSAAPLRNALGIPYYVTATYVGGKISVQSTAPSSPAKGDIWFDTT